MAGLSRGIDRHPSLSARNGRNGPGIIIVNGFFEIANSNCGLGQVGRRHVGLETSSAPKLGVECAATRALFALLLSLRRRASVVV